MYLIPSSPLHKLFLYMTDITCCIKAAFPGNYVEDARWPCVVSHKRGQCYALLCFTSTVYPPSDTSSASMKHILEWCLSKSCSVDGYIWFRGQFWFYVHHQLNEVHHLLRDIHTYATLKFIPLKMQIVPGSNINSVSAEPNYYDSTKAHFASVPLSGCPTLSIKWCDRLTGRWWKISGVCFDHRTC